MNKIKTVQDLIDELSDIENKSLPIFAYVTTENDTYNLYTIEIDTTISDRVDINIDLT